MKQIIFLATLFLSSIGYSQNHSLAFDGTDDYVDLGNEIGENIRTIELWFNPTLAINNTLSEFKSLVVRDDLSEADEIHLAFDQINGTKGKIRFGRNTTTGFHVAYSNSDSWNANQWYHVAGVFHPVDGIELYIDGVKQTDKDPDTGAPGSRSEITSIGAWGSANIRFFNGKIDDVRFWTVARTQSEIVDNMNTELSGTESGLKSYFQMDETNSSCNVEDCNINGNHGIRKGVAGQNYLPQYSGLTPSLTDIQCGASNSCISCPLNTTFSAIVNNNWDSAGNWTGGCVPDIPINENIIIDGDCNVQISENVILDPNGMITINSGFTLTVTN